MVVLACFAGLGLICTTLPRDAQGQVLQLSTGQVVETQDPTSATVLRIGFGPVTRVAFGGGLSESYQLPLIFFNSREYFSVDKRAVRFNLFSAANAGAPGFRAGPMVNVDFGPRTPQGGRLLPSYRRGSDRIFSGFFVKYAF